MAVILNLDQFSTDPYRYVQSKNKNSNSNSSHSDDVVRAFDLYFRYQNNNTSDNKKSFEIYLFPKQQQQWLCVCRSLQKMYVNPMF